MQYVLKLAILMPSLLAACTVQVTNPGTGEGGKQPAPMPSATWTNLGLGGRLILIHSELLDRILGIITASAHGVPSDWYRVSVSGNDQLVRLTNLEDTGMYAHISLDGKCIVFIAQTGLYVMSLDGSSLTYLSPLVLGGTLDWVPLFIRCSS